jgi:membrane-bound lytic murein transglycosylase
LPKFKKTNELLENVGAKREASIMSTEDFLKDTLRRLKVRTAYVVPTERCTMLQKSFEIAMKDLIEWLARTNDTKMTAFFNPVVKKLRKKNVSEKAAFGHVYREAIKLMFAKGLISGPGEYVVLFE